MFILLEFLRCINFNEFDFPRMAAKVTKVVRLAISVRNKDRGQILQLQQSWRLPEHFCNGTRLRNANNVSEPLAASRCGSKYVIKYVHWFKHGTVSIPICHMCHIIIQICTHLCICIANTILANWPELLRNCRSQFPHSWVKNCSETGRIRAISM